jgi:hypothetical protein
VEKSSPGDKKAKLVRTLSTKFAKQMVAKETTGRKQLTRAALNVLEKKLSSSERMDVAESFLFDPRVWLEAFLTSKGVFRAQLRLFIQDTTRIAARDEHYWLVAGREQAAAPRRVGLSVHQRTIENVTMFNFANDEAPGRLLRETRYAGTAHFVYADVIDVGVFMKQEQKCDPLVLMFAHPTVLGGAQSGGFSQEDYILRRTNVGNLVNNDSNKPITRNWDYHLPEYAIFSSCYLHVFFLLLVLFFLFFFSFRRYGGVYVPSATVFRSNESTGYKFLLNPIRLSFFLASAPLNERSFCENRDAAFVADWRKRIDSVFAVGLQKGHDSLVLGAWGCGEMANDCAQVAALLKEAATTRFRGCFKHIVFAFLHDPEAFRVFQEAFGSVKMPVPTEHDLFDRKKRAGRKGLVAEAKGGNKTPATSKESVEIEIVVTGTEKQELADKEKQEMDYEADALDWRGAEIAW